MDELSLSLLFFQYLFGVYFNVEKRYILKLLMMLFLCQNKNVGKTQPSFTV